MFLRIREITHLKKWNVFDIFTDSNYVTRNYHEILPLHQIVDKRVSALDYIYTQHI